MTDDNPRPAVGNAAARQSPAAILHGSAHVIVYGNRPFLAEFGDESVGLPAVEALLDLPASAFALMDEVYRTGRALARWVTVRGTRRRLTVVERKDIGSGEIYGIAIHLVERDEVDER